MEREENFQEVVTRREEDYFVKLFLTVLTLMKGLANQEEIENDIEEDILIGIERMTAHFSGGPEGACDVNNFQEYGYRLGYFYWSSPIAAGVTRKKTLAALRECEAFRLNFSKPSLKVVSVGAGTGSDLVGLYSAIHEHFEQSQEQPFREMELLLMDNNISWEPFFRSVVKLLRHPDNDFGNAGQWMRNSNITTSFIHADLRQLSDDEQRELENTHIVWMKGIMAIQENNKHRRSIVNNIVSSMTSGALLVVLDSPSYHEYVFENDRLQRIFTTLYHPERYELRSFLGHLNIHRYLRHKYCSRQYCRHHFCRNTNQEISIFKIIEE